VARRPTTSAAADEVTIDEATELPAATQTASMTAQTVGILKARTMPSVRT
jgi:hypothetical protein